MQNLEFLAKEYPELAEAIKNEEKRQNSQRL